MTRALTAAVCLALALTGAGAPPVAAGPGAAESVTAGPVTAGPAGSPGGRAALLPALAPAAAPPAVAVSSDLDDVTSWSIGLASGPGVTTSPEIRTDPFTLAAVSWERTGAQPEHLELRVWQAGRWSEWFDLVVDESEAPDGRFASEPFIADGASRLQARIGAPAALEDLRLELVHVADDASGSPARVTTLVSNPATAPAATTPPGKVPATPAAGPSRADVTGDELRPRIVTRRGWGANERGTRQVSSSTWLKAMYVHHTAGPNSYSRSRSKAVVRSIWAFHTRSRGWPDIGYQFLVDRFGTIYEGRRGSITGLPVGAQAGGYNADTIGVAVMGNHTTVTPSKTVLDAVVDVLAWQAHRYGVDPRGKVKLRTARSTGSRTRWPYGRRTAALPVIRGHRDTNHTACPGARLYAKLPAIRRAVQSKVTRAERTHGTTPAQLRAPRVEPLRDRAERVSVPATVHLRWHEVPGARRYEILRRTAKHGQDPPQTQYAWMVESRTKRTATRVKVPRGQTWTIAVRAIDELGRPGKHRVIGTTTRPLRARQIERSGGWRTVERAAYFTGAAHVARERGATLTVRGATEVRAVWLVAATGPGRGRVAVSVGGERVGKVSLTGGPAAARRLVEVPLRKTRSGTVRIRTLSSKPVRISAVILERGRQ